MGPSREFILLVLVISSSFTAPVPPSRNSRPTNHPIGSSAPKPAKIPKLTEPRCKPILSEFYSDSGSGPRGKEFIEIRLNCAKKAGTVPKNLLAGYKLLVVRADPPSIVTYVDFDELMLEIAPKKEFIVLGSSKHEIVDVSLDSANVQSVLSETAASKLVPDWTQGAYAVMIVRDTSKLFRQDFGLSFGHSGRLQARVVGKYHADRLKGKVQDMIVLGNHDPAQLQFFQYVSNDLGQPSIRVPEWDDLPNSKSLGYSFCGNSFVGFKAEDYRQATPTPGRENSCSSSLPQTQVDDQIDQRIQASKPRENLLRFDSEMFKTYESKVPNLVLAEQCSQFLPPREGILHKPEYSRWLDFEKVEERCVFSCFYCKSYFKLGFRPDFKNRVELSKQSGYSSSDIYQASKIIRMHLDNPFHVEAVEFARRIMESNSKENFEKVVGELESKERVLYNSTMNIITMVYAEAYNSMSFSKHEPLMEVLALIGANIGIHHHTNVAAHNIVKVISDSFHKTLLQSLIASQSFFTLLCDSSTNTNDAYLICYLQTLENGLPISHFYALLHLVNGEKGMAMADVVKTKVQADDLIRPGFERYFKEYLVAIVSDGANSMVGDQNSFKTHLMGYVNRKVPNVICLAHRLDTAIKSSLKVPNQKVAAAKGEVERKRIMYYENFEDTSNKCFNFFNSRGHKKWLHLKKIAAELNVTPLTLKRFIKVRWSASHHNAMVAIDHDYEAMIVDLQRISMGDGQFDKSGLQSAATLYSKLSDKHYASTVREFLDFLSVFKEVSLTFQAASSVLIGKVEVLYTAIQKIQDLGRSIGTSLQAFLQKCSCTGICRIGECSLLQYEQCPEVHFKSVILRGTDPSARVLSQERQTLYANFVTGIKMYFKLDIFSAFELFDPKWIAFLGNSNGQPASTGSFYRHNPRAHSLGIRTNEDGKLRVICQFYFLTDQECTQFSADWLVIIRQITSDAYLAKYADEGPVEFWKLALEQDFHWTDLVKRIIQYVSVTAYSSAICERGFSFVNGIKTKERANMSKETLNALVRIKANGPPVSKFDSFKYTKEFFMAGYVRADDRQFKGGRPEKNELTCKAPEKSGVY